MSKVLLIGCGHMGSALLNSWLDLKSYSLAVVDPFNFKELKKNYNKKKVDVFSKTPTQNQIKQFDIIIFN